MRGAKKAFKMHSNKRMQPDQNARCALILTADARRYVAVTNRPSRTTIRLCHKGLFLERSCGYRYVKF